MFYDRSSKPSRLIDLISLAEEDTSEEDVIIPILPPEKATDCITDEDSGEEDVGGTINNLPASMLRVPAILDDKSSSDDEQFEQKRKKARGMTESGKIET